MNVNFDYDYEVLFLSVDEAYGGSRSYSQPLVGRVLTRAWQDGMDGAAPAGPTPAV